MAFYNRWTSGTSYLAEVSTTQARVSRGTLVLTPPANKSVRVRWWATTSVEEGAGVPVITVELNGVVKDRAGESSKEVIAARRDLRSIGGWFVIPASASPVQQTVELFYGMSGAGALFLSNVRFVADELPAGSVYKEQASGRLTVAASSVLTELLETDPLPAGDYIIETHGVFDIASASHMPKIQLEDTAGANDGFTAYLRTNNIASKMVMNRTWLRTATQYGGTATRSGAITADQQVRINGAPNDSTGTMGYEFCRILAIPTAAYDNVYVTENAAVSSGSQTAATDALTFTPTIAQAGDHLVSAQAWIEAANTSNSSNVTLEEGAEVISDYRWESISTTADRAHHAFSAGRLSLLSAGALTVRLRRKSGTSYATQVEIGATIVILDLGVAPPPPRPTSSGWWVDEVEYEGIQTDEVQGIARMNGQLVPITDVYDPATGFLTEAALALCQSAQAVAVFRFEGAPAGFRGLMGFDPANRYVARWFGNGRDNTQPGEFKVGTEQYAADIPVSIPNAGAPVGAAFSWDAGGEMEISANGSAPTLFTDQRTRTATLGRIWNHGWGDGLFEQAARRSFILAFANGFGKASGTRITGTDLQNIAVPQASAPTIELTGTPGAAEVGQVYTATFAATGGTAPYVLTLESGTMPPGLAISGMTITGTPTQAGTYNNLVLRATDADGYWDELVVSITVAAAPAALSISGSPATATVNQAYSFAPTISGGQAPYTLSAPNGGLPAGLAISGNTVAGTPTAVGTTANVLLRATDNLGATADLTVTFIVNEAPVNTSFPTLIYEINPATTGLAWRNRQNNAGYALERNMYAGSGELTTRMRSTPGQIGSLVSYNEWAYFVDPVDPAWAGRSQIDITTKAGRLAYRFKAEPNNSGVTVPNRASGVPFPWLSGVFTTEHYIYWGKSWAIEVDWYYESHGDLYWPAEWDLTKEDDPGPDRASEIDYIEFQGDITDEINHVGVHGPRLPAETQPSIQKPFGAGVPITGAWHTIRVEYDDQTNTLTGYIDGVLKYTRAGMPERFEDNMRYYISNLSLADWNEFEQAPYANNPVNPSYKYVGGFRVYGNARTRIGGEHPSAAMAGDTSWLAGSLGGVAPSVHFIGDDANFDNSKLYARGGRRQPADGASRRWRVHWLDSGSPDTVVGWHFFGPIFDALTKASGTLIVITEKTQPTDHASDWGGIIATEAWNYLIQASPTQFYARYKNGDLAATKGNSNPDQTVIVKSWDQGVTRLAVDGGACAEVAAPGVDMDWMGIAQARAGAAWLGDKPFARKILQVIYYPHAAAMSAADVTAASILSALPQIGANANMTAEKATLAATATVDWGGITAQANMIAAAATLVSDVDLPVAANFNRATDSSELISGASVAIVATFNRETDPAVLSAVSSPVNFANFNRQAADATLSSAGYVVNGGWFSRSTDPAWLASSVYVDQNVYWLPAMVGERMLGEGWALPFGIRANATMTTEKAVLVAEASTSIKGNFNRTTANAVLSSEVDLPIAANMNRMLRDDVLSSLAKLHVAANFTALLQPAVLAATAAIRIAANFNRTTDNAVVTADAIAYGVTINFNVTLDPAVLEADAQLAVYANFNRQAAAAVLAASGPGGIKRRLTFIVRSLRPA